MGQDLFATNNINPNGPNDLFHLNGIKPPSDATQNLVNQANQNAYHPQNRTPQMQEEYSNPSITPGFNQLPQSEQLKRIAFSAYDPANISPTGGMVPPGTFESPTARMVATTLPTLATPEFSELGSILNPLAKSIYRVGSGTAGNVAYNLPEIKNMNQFKNLATRSAGLNALIEGATWPLRAASTLAEVYNPMDYTANKADQIKNEYKMADQAVNNEYEPVLSQYGSNKVTIDPEKYLGFDKQDVKKFTPIARQSYNDFINTGNFKNLHDLQSTLGTEASNLATEKAKIKTYQTMIKSRNTAKQKIQQFLSSDPVALAKYNKGGEITKNILKPYESDQLLDQITSGVNQNVSPSELENAIESGRKKIIGYDKNKNAVTAIPPNHPLINHLNDLKNKTSFGRAVQGIVPTAMGTVLGELIHPGLGGAIGGGVAGAIESKLLSPMLANLIKEPWIQKTARILNPLYYGAARTGVNAFNQNQ